MPNCNIFLTPHEPPLTGLARLGYIIPMVETPRDPERTSMTRMLDRLCPIPDPNESSGEFERYHHNDLAAMSRADLRREIRSVRSRLELEERPAAWLYERLNAIHQALAIHKTASHAAPPHSDAAADPERPYHKPLPGLRRTMRGLRSTLTSGL